MFQKHNYFLVLRFFSGSFLVFWKGSWVTFFTLAELMSNASTQEKHGSVLATLSQKFGRNLARNWARNWARNLARNLAEFWTEIWPEISRKLAGNVARNLAGHLAEKHWVHALLTKEIPL